MFDAISISSAFVSEIEAVSIAGVFQRVRNVNEKYRVVDVVFLTQLGEEHLSKKAS